MKLLSWMILISTSCVYLVWYKIRFPLDDINWFGLLFAMAPIMKHGCFERKKHQQFERTFFCQKEIRAFLIYQNYLIISVQFDPPPSPTFVLEKPRKKLFQCSHRYLQPFLFFSFWNNMYEDDMDLNLLDLDIVLNSSQ